MVPGVPSNFETWDTQYYILGNAFDDDTGRVSRTELSV